MVSVRLKNIRSLQDTGQIDLRPITILVGTNSSGKSTFTRMFPLLKQSVEVHSNTPVLWYGDLVDFGTINEVKPTFAPEDDVCISLGMSPEEYGSTYFTRSLGSLKSVQFEMKLNSEPLDSGKTILKIVQFSSR